MTQTVTQDTNRVVFKGWLPAQEAADYLGVSREYVYRIKAIYDEGGAGIPGFMLGDSSRVLMFRIKDLDAYARKHPELGKSRNQPDPDPEADEEDKEAGESNEDAPAPEPVSAQ
jgi:hypothetical protein